MYYFLFPNQLRYNLFLYSLLIDGIRESFSIQTMLALMKVANVEEDELSEQLQKNLIEKNIELDKYVAEMLRLRRSYNLRRIKIDKLTDLENTSGGYVRHSPSSPSSYHSDNRPHGPYPGL